MAVTNQQIIDFLLANPGMSDAQIVSAMAQYGVSPAQMASAVGLPVEQVTSRVAATLPSNQSVQLGDTVVKPTTVQPSGLDSAIKDIQSQTADTTKSSVSPWVALYQNTLGRNPTQAELNRWGDSPTITPEQLNIFLGQARNEAINTMPKTGAVGNIAQQILAQGNTSKWTGTGFGSPEKNAYDMAVMLAGQGITDLNQLGTITKTIPASQEATEGGVIDIPERKVTVYGNKETGQEISPYYDKAGEIGADIWSGTFAGGGSTAYGVSFDASGKPTVYTRYGGSSNNAKDYLVPAAVLAAPYLASALGGAGLFGGEAAAGTGGLTALEGGSLATGATGTGLTTSGLMGAGTGLTTAGAGGLGGAMSTLGGEAALGTGLTTSGVGGLGAAGTGAGIGAGSLGATNSLLGGAALGATAAGASALPVGTALAGLGAAGAGTSLLGGAAGSAGGSLLGGTLGSAAGSAASSLLGNAITSGLGLAGGVMQSQASKEAAQKAAADIAKATQQGVEASQFRPVGMTTRFGTSNYTYDPVTGRMTSAGYQLSPEAKAAQDRLVALAGSGLTQAEQAQAQFAPLQTGAQSLFGLGNQYISQSPQDVAQNYLNQQMALLQPSRELELANLQNRLQQQGRAGLSVAQGGTLGATTPELQALYNARAMQEAQLAANAQQAGQQNVLFGAGLLGQGAQAMGNYYGGQTAAYQPYTTALGQIQNLETAAQQPLTMGANLAQQASAAGANAGKLGVTGAIGAGSIMTSPAVTNNPYATFLGGLSSPQSLLGQGIANFVTGYDASANQNAVLNPYFTSNTSVWGS